MNFTEGDSSYIKELCRLGKLNTLAEQYVDFCRGSDSKEGSERSDKRSASKKENQSFPNYAGFCRYVGLSPQGLEAILKDFPVESQRLSVILEDEALNSSVSPTIVSAYLKKRLGYDKEAPVKKAEETQLKITFEHNIFEDGE